MSTKQAATSPEPEAILMAATRIIEEERGAYVGHVHPHNGYYAGDFSRRAVRTPIVPNTHPVAPIPALPFIDRSSRRSPRG